MKQLNKLFTILLMLCMMASQAQNKENRLLIGFGAHGPNMTFGDDKGNYYKNWNIVPAISQIKIFNYINKGFSLGWQLSLGNAKRYDSVEGKFFLQWGVDLKYSFANGYILKEKSWFDPYFLIGGGLNKWGNTRGSINFGAGLNLWVAKNVALFVQTQYDYMPHGKVSPHAEDPRPSFMHHSFGLVVRVGRAKDTDRDGVPDSEDKCPTDPGKPELDGCPDTDGDGIIDKDDKCPTVAGIAQFQGCPDTDGDGIPDMDDACPTKASPAATRGCPDKDGDGIADIDDKCPDQPGTKANNGCPEAPKPAPTVVTEEVKKAMTYATQNVQFATSSSTLLATSLPHLNNVANILKANPALKVHIEGHTDSRGNEKVNQTLSTARAKACQAYLISKGVAADRLTAEGFGSTRPIADNATKQGLELNRRVDFVVY